MKKLFSKKLLSIILCVVCVMSILPTISVNAAGKVWSGKTDTSWFTNDKDSYDIYTAEQLAGLAEIVNTKGDEFRLEGVTINLMNDIVLNNTKNWKKWTKDKPAKNKWIPIGQTGSPIMGYRPFAGNFNGNGHKISGMFVCGNGNDDCGLFSYTSGSFFKDVTIDKSVIITDEEYNQSSAGALVGCSEYSYFGNCKATNVKIEGSASIGGLIGRASQKNYLIETTQALLLAFGIVLNPLYIRGMESDMPEKLSITYITDCSVSNATMKTSSIWYSGDVGGVIGTIDTPASVVSCKSNKIKALSVDRINYNSSLPLPIDINKVKQIEKDGGLIHKGYCGAIYGSKNENALVAECGFSNFKRLDNSKERSDSSDVKK